MPTAHPYVTADELREEIQSGAVGSLALEGLYGRAVLAASVAVDSYTFRTFTSVDDDTDATARTFKTTPCLTVVDELDDIADATDLAVATDGNDGGTYSLVDPSTYVLELDNQTGMVTGIRSIGLFPSSSYGRRTVQVAARWGWPATPQPIIAATMIWAMRLVNRRVTPTGVVGFGEFGGVKLSTIDPDVKALLAPYRRTSRLLR